MQLGKYRTVLALAIASILGGFDGRGSEACSCMPDRSLCDGFRAADMVVRAKAISRAGGSSSSDMAQFADITYTVEVIALYKEDGGIENSLSFITPANSSLCGIWMEVREDGEENQEYLLDLNRIESSGDLRAVGLCGLFKEWDDDDTEFLEGACASTSNPSPSPAQAQYYIPAYPDNSSALRLVTYRGFAAAFVALLAGIVWGFDSCGGLI